MKLMVDVLLSVVMLTGCAPSAQDPRDIAQKFIDVLVEGKVNEEFVEKYFVPGMPKDWCKSANIAAIENRKAIEKDFDKKNVKDRTSRWVHEASFISEEDSDLILLQIKEYVGNQGAFTGSMYISLRRVSGKWLIQNPFEYGVSSSKSKWKKTWSYRPEK